MKKAYKEFYFITIFLFSLLLAYIVAFQCFGVSKDFHGYENYFTNQYVTMEPFWRPLQWLNIHVVHNVTVFFFLITFISIFIKFYAVYLLEEKYVIFFMIGYAISCFFLHEYTQFRISFAVAIFVLEHEWFMKKDFRKSLIVIIICTMIHYSCILLLVYYFYCKISRKQLYIIIPVLSFLLVIILRRYCTTFDIIKKLLDFIKLNKIKEIVLKKSFESKAISYKALFSLRYLVFLMIIIFVYIKLIDKGVYTKGLLFSFKAVSFSLTCYYLFSTTGISTLPLRFSELFLPFYICFLVETFRFIKEKSLGFIILSFLLLLFSRTYLIMTGII